MAKKKIPEFKSEEEEIEFWNTHDATEYFDESDHVEIDFSPVREKIRKKRVIEAARLRREKKAS